MRRLLKAFLSATFVAVMMAAPGVEAKPFERGEHSQKLSGALEAILAQTAATERVRVIVQGRAAAEAARAHGNVVKKLDFVGGVAANVPAASLRRLANDPRVDFVAPDAPIAFAADGVISTASLATFYPGRASVSNPWNAGATGRGVGIAVIDSGVTPSADFGSRLVQVALEGQTEPLDDAIGHGTMVAGAAAGHSPDGKFIGIAPGATVYALNVNRAGGVYSSDVITALKWVFDNAQAYNIRVVNLSLVETLKSSYTENPLNLAVERVWASGVFVVVAAGNRGAGEIDYAPANDPLAMTIGAFDVMGTSGPGDDTYLPWSSSGNTVDGFSKPELVAPGRHIASPLPSGTALDRQAPVANRPIPGYARINGTSFAAPQVAGAAAIIFQWHPTWSPDNVKWALIAKQGAKPRNSKWGALSLSSSYNISGTPGKANQGYPALVCAPGSKCTKEGTVASKWDSSAWTPETWPTNAWASATWNETSWSSGTDWVANGWVANGWVANGWVANGWVAADFAAGFDPWQ